MHITSVTCPKCAKALRLPQALPVGSKVRCTACGVPFALQTRASVAAVPARPPVAVAPIASRAPVTAAPKGGGFLLGLLLGGLIMLGGASVGLALYFNRDSDKSSDNPKAKADDDRTASNDPKPEEKKHATTEVVKPKDKDKPDETVVRPADPVKTEPVKLEPVNPEPVKPDPVKPDPVKPDPVKPDPVKPDPNAKLVEGSLSREEQEKVNSAIDAGVRNLKGKQEANGSWPEPELKNYSGLPGLVLLECGVPATDAAVVKAAENVRLRIPTMDDTYQISITLLFLDRLGNPDDRSAIQSLALRLVACQSPVGGWGYAACRSLPPQNEADFLKALVLTRPKNNYELFVVGPDHRLHPGLLGAKPALVPGIRLDPDVPFRNAELRLLIAGLPGIYQQSPSLQLPSTIPPNPPEPDNIDNSNTQFAMLALLAAARHDVPIERSLSLAFRRFRRLQDPVTGGWKYSSAPDKSITPSMTCAGLLGLAVGRGLLATAKPGIPGMKFLDDPGVQAGLRKAGASIGRPLDGMTRGGTAESKDVSLYYLWSLERVGVIYNLPKIDGKDWYAWGVGLLLKGQKPDGSWYYGNFFGSSNTVDTCLALLFLKRANLAKELTITINKLELITEDKPPK